MAGYEDGATSTHTLDRIRAIRRNRKAWLRPVLRHLKRVVVPSKDWIESRSHKDVIAGRVPDDHSRLDVVYLSSSIPDSERYRQLRFDITFDALHIEPGQDLVVLASLALTPDAA